jgi:hypothetical protein
MALSERSVISAGRPQSGIHHPTNSDDHLLRLPQAAGRNLIKIGGFRKMTIMSAGVHSELRCGFDCRNAGLPA